jgi:hypothetical protein
VIDTAAVPPVPALQHTHGKSTSGFAGSERASCAFPREIPPECNTRPLERQDYSRSLDYATEEMATAATPSSTFKPSSLPPLLLPLPIARPLVGCKQLAPAGPAYSVAAQTMPATGGTYVGHLPSFSHYSGFAGIGAFAAMFKHVSGRCEGGFEWCEGTAAVFEKLNPAVKLGGGFRQIDIAAAPSCDVYDAGAPCQSFSVAGRKAGLDLRGNLVFEQLSYLRVHKPLPGVFEQVPNFAQLEQGGATQIFSGAAPRCRIHSPPPGVRGQALRCVPAPRTASGSGSQV